MQPKNITATTHVLHAHLAAHAASSCCFREYAAQKHNCHYPRSACPPGSPCCQLLLRHPLSHSHALDSPSSKFQIVPSRANDLHKLLRAVKFASACRLPMSSLPNSSTAPVLVSLSP